MPGTLPSKHETLSVNPARSTGVALFAEGPALAQLWLFWVAPIVGAALAGVAYKSMFEDDTPVIADTIVPAE